MTLQPGTFVRHAAQPAWGTGKVLELVAPDKVRIRFASGGEKLLLVSAAALETIDPSETDQRALAERRAKARKTAGPAKSHDELVAAFLQKYPGGFESPAYAKDERDYKVKAHELARQELGADRLRELLGAGRFDEIVDAALRVMNATNLVFPNEKIAFKKALSTAPIREEFGRRFVELLHGEGPYQARFESFADFLIGHETGKWTVATYFPYLLFPQEHMFLKPQVTQRAADAYSWSLEYEAQPNWRTYERLLAFSQMLRERMGALAPADMLDVQSFLWVAGNA